MTHRSESDQSFREVPDHWLATILHYATSGYQNGTSLDYSDPMVKPELEDIYPLFVIQYAVLSVFSILANVLLLYYIVHYKLYRDCTHAFLANLSLAQLVLCAVVLPITMMVIIIQNWIYGQFMCFFLPLLQVRNAL